MTEGHAPSAAEGKGKGKGKGQGGKEGPPPRGEKGDSGTGKGGKVETRKRYVL